MKRSLSQQSTGLVFGIVSLVFLNACRREDYWERTLIGSFLGEPFTGELKTQPVSSLQLQPQFVLEIYWEGATNDPIMRLRRTNGISEWARILVPRLEGQEEPRGRITSLTLNEIKVATNGYKVMMLCDWTGGGRERGIVYLDTNRAFRSFALGW